MHCQPLVVTPPGMQAGRSTGGRSRGHGGCPGPPCLAGGCAVPQLRSQASHRVKDRGGSAAGTGPYVTPAFPAGRGPSAPGSAAFQGFLLFDLPVAPVSVTWMGRAGGSLGPCGLRPPAQIIGSAGWYLGDTAGGRGGVRGLQHTNAWLSSWCNTCKATEQ